MKSLVVRRRTGRSLARASPLRSSLGGLRRFPGIEIHGALSRVVDRETLDLSPGMPANVSRAFSAIEITRARSKFSSYWKVTRASAR